MLICLGFKVLKPPLQLLNGFTQEAISSLQLPTTLEQPAKVSRCRLWTEVGLTLLRACPIFLMSSFCTLPDTIVRNRVQRYKISVQLLWTDFEKVQKICIFHGNRVKLLQNRQEISRFRSNLRSSRYYPDIKRDDHC